jgi:tRNA pseudouridine55 synthase
VHGFLVVDKPLGISSREAVDRVQAALPPDVRVGHTGTLDPLASGVLVLALGQATRLTDYVQRQTKEYRAGVRFGATSATDDAEGPLTPVADVPPPTRSQLEAALAGFIGTIEQTPPAFSAAHVGGQRAYRMARKGKAVNLQAKPVRIDRIDLLAYQPPDADLIVRCGKGTYIRSIARDLGRVLGCGAYLSSLRRTRVGPFLESHALPVDADGAEFAAKLRPLGDAMDGLPRLTLTSDEVRRLSMGQNVATAATDDCEVAIFDDAGDLRAVALIAEGRLRPIKVFQVDHA